MNKTIIVIFALLNYFQSFSQENLYIEYEVVFNTDRPTKTKRAGQLYINSIKNKSIYRTVIVDTTKIGKKAVIDNKIELTLSSTVEEFNLFNFNENKLITREDIFNDSFLISEDIPNFNWTLLEETKKLDSLVLNKATCYFRGRKYIAWYSLEKPIKSGPWKFNGLPGLIYEVYDETNRYNWYLKKIEKSNFEFNELNIDYSKENAISIQKFAELRNSKSKEFTNQLMSKLPRTTEVKSEPIKRTGFEIKYEWEE
jgi:GLPGLI family protein